VQALTDRYRLLDRLGSGGMAVVWRAFDEVLARQVAIKVLCPETARRTDQVRGFWREARAIACLSNPHIGVVYDFGEYTGPGGARLAFVVMELVEGPSLQQRLVRGPLAWLEALRVCAQIADGLAAAHARGLVHRDVKPANVLLSSGGVKLVDFGISAVVGQPADSAQDGFVMGTPAYVAPERLAGASVGPGADVYSLGIVLYETLTGRRPWRVSGDDEALAAHLLRDPAPLPPIDGLPTQIRDLCRRCLAKDPDARPAAPEVALRGNLE
jgi:serine/threonine-protein kinase